MSLLFHYIQTALGYFFIASIICFIFCAVRNKFANRSFCKYDFVLILFTGYLFAMLSQTVFPDIDFGIINNTGGSFSLYLDINIGVENPISGVNLIPFKTIFLYITGTELIKVLNPGDVINVRILNLFGNLLMFMPMGFFLPIITKKHSFKTTLCISVIITVLIEIIQFFIGRSSDIDDVILNSIGCCLGFLCFSLYKKSGIRLKA